MKYTVLRDISYPYINCIFSIFIVFLLFIKNKNKKRNEACPGEKYGFLLFFYLNSVFKFKFDYRNLIYQ